MTNHSFEHKIKTSLEAFEDQTPPSFAEWHAVAAAIGNGAKKGFAFYAWRVLAGLAALLFLLFGGKLLRDNAQLKQQIESLNQKVERNHLFGHLHQHLAKDTVVLIQQHRDTIYIVQKSAITERLSSTVPSNSRLENPFTKIASDSKPKTIADEITPKTKKEMADKSVNSSVKPFASADQIGESSNSVILDERQEDRSEPINDPPQIAQAEMVELKSEPQTQQTDEHENEKTAADASEVNTKKRLNASSYVSLVGARAMPYADQIKETNLMRVSGEYEYRIAGRFGVLCGFQYSFLKYEHHVNDEILEHFSGIDPSYYDLYTTINGFNIPLRFKFYVLPDKTLTPFVSAGLISQVYHQSKYRFTDAPTLAETQRLVSGFELKPQFALLSAGVSIFNKSKFGGDLEFQYNHGLSKSGFADTGINALGGSLRLFYRLN